MPEGDSVYRLARRLDASLRGRRLRGRGLLGRGLADGSPGSRLQVAAYAEVELGGATVLGHDTHGKHLLTRLDDGRTLHTHLRMQGSWSVLRRGRRLPPRRSDDVRVVLATEAGVVAYGLDLPVVDLLPTAEEPEVIGHLGPDPLRADWDASAAVLRLGADPDRPLAAALLDQRLMAGLGNLWANELCFLRGHSPWTPVGEVDLVATVALAARCLRHSALVPGAYQVTTGRNRAGEDHWVAGRAGQRCRRCGTVIEVVAEVPNDPDRRRTWWCPSCQPGPPPDRPRG